MKLCMIDFDEKEQPAIVYEKGLIPLTMIKDLQINGDGMDLLNLIQNDQLMTIVQWYEDHKEEIEQMEAGAFIPHNEVIYRPLLNKQEKNIGIGLNYQNHASQLGAKTPGNIPAIFFKGNHTIIGHGESVHIPRISHRTTGEAELGIVIGKTCHQIKEKEWQDYVAGFTTIIDMTAEDILRKNPRYLTLSKNFNRFFSIGPHLLTPDEIPDIQNITVSTILNDEVVAANTISNMIFSPGFLVAFHSRVMTLNPGDVISTGTPGAAPLSKGDIIECRIDGFKSLINPVKDMKLK
ncbi:MAG: fumarylacetoacetate hydrolase [Caldithrix sp.]|nr:fumarylacetoacetate hydrolase [Caldithrix sp.]